MIELNVLGVTVKYENEETMLGDLTPVDIEAGRARINAFIAANNNCLTGPVVAEKFGLDRVVVETFENGIQKTNWMAYGETFFTTHEAA